MNIGFSKHAVYFSSSRQERGNTPIESHSGISTPASVRTSASTENLAEQAIDTTDRLNWQGIISNDIHQEIIAGINGQKAVATMLKAITRQWQNKYNKFLSQSQFLAATKDKEIAELQRRLESEQIRRAAQEGRAEILEQRQAFSNLNPTDQGAELKKLRLKVVSQDLELLALHRREAERVIKEQKRQRSEFTLRSTSSSSSQGND